MGKKEKEREEKKDGVESPGQKGEQKSGGGKHGRG